MSGVPEQTHSSCFPVISKGKVRFQVRKYFKGKSYNLGTFDTVKECCKALRQKWPKLYKTLTPDQLKLSDKSDEDLPVASAIEKAKYKGVVREVRGASQKVFWRIHIKKTKKRAW